MKKFTALLCVCVVCVQITARAETAFFDNGNSISVKSHRIEGDSVVLTLNGGGEMVSRSSSIVRFGPDDPKDPKDVQPAAFVVPPATPILESAPLPHGAWANWCRCTSSRARILKLSGFFRRVRNVNA